MVFIIKINNYKSISFYQIISPLSEIAIDKGHKDVVEFLARNGADINHKDDFGRTALICGINNKDHFFQLNFILSNISSSF